MVKKEVKGVLEVLAQKVNQELKDPKETLDPLVRLVAMASDEPVVCFAFCTHGYNSGTQTGL